MGFYIFFIVTHIIIIIIIIIIIMPWILRHNISQVNVPLICNPTRSLAQTTVINVQSYSKENLKSNTTTLFLPYFRIVSCYSLLLCPSIILCFSYFKIRWTKNLCVLCLRMLCLKCMIKLWSTERNITKIVSYKYIFRWGELDCEQGIEKRIYLFIFLVPSQLLKIPCSKRKFYCPNPSSYIT